MNKTIANVTFLQFNCNVQLEKYNNNGRTAITLIDTEDNGPVATCTINLDDVQLTDDEVIIKDYSENEGMLDCLIAAGIVSDPIRYVDSGFIKAPVCKLLKT